MLISGTWRDFRHIWWDDLVMEVCALHFGKNRGCFLLERPNVLREDLYGAYKHERKMLMSWFTQKGIFCHYLLARMLFYTVLTFLAIKIKRRKYHSFPCRVNWSQEICRLLVWNLTNTRLSVCVTDYRVMFYFTFMLILHQSFSVHFFCNCFEWAALSVSHRGRKS